MWTKLAAFNTKRTILYTESLILTLVLRMEWNSLNHIPDYFSHSMAMSCASILYICKRQLLHRNTTNDIYIHFAEQKLAAGHSHRRWTADERSSWLFIVLFALSNQYGFDSIRYWLVLMRFHINCIYIVSLFIVCNATTLHMLRQQYTTEWIEWASIHRAMGKNNAAANRNKTTEIINGRYGRDASNEVKCRTYTHTAMAKWTMDEDNTEPRMNGAQKTEKQWRWQQHRQWVEQQRRPLDSMAEYLVVLRSYCWIAMDHQIACFYFLSHCLRVSCSTAVSLY